jgi:glutamine cyclotransferase
MKTGSRRDRVLSGARLPGTPLDRVGAQLRQVSLVCLFGILGVVLLACGAPSPSLETAFPTQVVPSTGTTLVVSPTAQVTANPTTPGNPARPTPTSVELSPLPTPTAASQQVSPLPTPTSAGHEASPLPTPTASPPPTLTVGAAGESVPTYTYRIVQVFPHDPAAYIQGLVFEDGVFYEGTGLYGESSLRRVDPESGAVLQLHNLPSDLFGEGITLWQDRIIQLTWKAQLGMVYGKDSFEQLDTFHYPTEGWGITHDGTRLIMSDGTSTLHFWDPETFEELGTVEVVGQTGPVSRLNELEYIEGLVYANVYQTDLIAMIEPDTGQVTGWIDLTGILGFEIPSGSGNVLNGIAYSEQDQRLFVTGKRWPRLFEIELVPLLDGG